MTGAPTLVELSGVSKSFGATRALRAVDLSLAMGEVHVLAGENGAGKSTLIRILSGVIRDFEGTLYFKRRRVLLEGPRAAQALGIATIHQELSLVGCLSIADNLALCSPESMWRPTSSGLRAQQARAALDTLGLDVDPKTLAQDLPLQQRQLVEIARALSQKAELLIMDEPTSALGDPGVKLLFSRIRQLRERNITIVFITHRMDEIYEIADRISVLRDGRLVETARARDLPREELVKKMVGRSIVSVAPQRPSTFLPKRLEVEGLSVRSTTSGPPLSDISFELRRGEVLGVAGLQGSGASELLFALGGALPRESGTLRLDGAVLSARTVREASAAGVILQPGDRSLSIFPELSPLENVTLASLQSFSRAGFIQKRIERRAVAQVTQRMAVTTVSLDSPACQLSGGNQQKLVLCRCLLAEPKLLLLDDPTRGIDIGAKADTYALISELSQQGVSVLLYSSELEELLQLSARILVLSRGRISTTLSHKPFRADALMKAAMGAASDVR